MTLGEIKTYAEIIEITFKILALVIAGVWAVYGFIAFRQRQTAVTALRKVESEVAGLELAAKRRAVLDISLKCEVQRVADLPGYVLQVQAIITNDGVDAAYMQFDESKPPIRVQLMGFDVAGRLQPVEDATLVAIPQASDFSRPSKSRVIRAGGSSRLTSVVLLTKPGVYGVGFRVPMDEPNRQAMFEVVANTSRSPYWSATAFVIVGTQAAAIAPAG